MIRINKFLSLAFLFAWVAGEAPRLWWKEAPPIRPMDVVVLMLVVMDIVRRIRGIRRKRGGKAMTAIAGVAAASWILGLRMWPLEDAPAGLLYLLRTMVYFWLIWRAKEILGEVRRWIPAAMAAFVGLGFLQYIFLPDTRFLLSYGWDEHYWRLIGTVLDPNYFGVMAGMIGIYFLNKCYKNYKFNKQKAIILMALASFITLVLTWSRASWIAFGAAAGWWGISGRSGKLGRLGVLGGLVMLGVVVWWVAPKPGGEGVNLLRTASIDQRIESWSEAITVWKQHPWLGVGFKDYGSELPSSSWLVILQSVGIIGTIGVIVGGIRVIREIGENRFWMAVAMMLGIHAIFNNTLFYPPVLGLVAMMRAMDAK